MLERPLYRGVIECGRTQKAYGRELRRQGSKRERGRFLPRPTASFASRRHGLRIIDADLAARVDSRREDRCTRYLASVAKGGRVPERAHGKC